MRIVLLRRNLLLLLLVVLVVAIVVVAVEVVVAAAVVAIYSNVKFQSGSVNTGWWPGLVNTNLGQFRYIQIGRQVR